jgi:hypothetical protein
MSFRDGLGVFGNKFGCRQYGLIATVLAPRTTVDARAHIEPLRSSQQRLIRIEYDLSCSRRCG